MIFAGVWLLGSAVFSLCFSYSDLTIFQDRDLQRAANLLSGQLIWHGAETFRGYHNPGNFYYLLLASFVSIGGWKAAWLGMVVLAALGGAGAWLYLTRRFGQATGIVWVLTYFGYPLAPTLLFHFWNPSFTLLFSLFGLCMIVETFAFNPSRKNLIIALMCCALGIQIHFLAAVFFIAIVILHFCSQGLDVRRLKHRDFVASIAVVSIWFLPYLFWCLRHSNLERKAPADHWTVSVALQNAWNYLGINGWGQALADFGLNVVLWLPVIPILLFAMFRRRLGKPDVPKTVLTVLAVIAAVSALPGIYGLAQLNCIPKARFVSPLGLTLTFAISILLGRFIDRNLPLRLGGSIRISILALLISGAVATHVWLPGLMARRRPDFPTITELLPAIQAIQLRTGWGESEFRKKLFLFNLDPEVAWRPLLDESIKGRDGFEGKEEIQGILLAMGDGLSLEKVKSTQHSSDLLRGFVGGQLEIYEHWKFGRLQAYLLVRSQSN